MDNIFSHQYQNPWIAFSTYLSFSWHKTTKWHNSYFIYICMFKICKNKQMMSFSSKVPSECEQVENGIYWFWYWCKTIWLFILGSLKSGEKKFYKIGMKPRRACSHIAAQGIKCGLCLHLIFFLMLDRKVS